MNRDEKQFEETQYLRWWLNAIMAGGCVLLGGALMATALAEGSSMSPAIAVPLLVLLLLVGIILLFFRMTTTVYRDRIVVRFGWTNLVRFTIPLAEVKSCRPVTYRPLLEFGGWGIRLGWKGRRAYSMRGNRAAEVVTTRRTILIGSDVPEQLCAAVNSLLPRPEPAAPGPRPGG
jgi:hypothetical protein